MVRYAKLQLPFNLKEMQADLSIAAAEWQPHFNTHYYNGSWTVLALRSPGGSHTNIIPDLMEKSEYQDTPYMSNFFSVKKMLSTIKCPILSVRFLNLQAGAIIKEHRDNELAFEKGEARLHFPVITNPNVEFYCENDRIILQEGECWYVNANLPHRVTNKGDNDRIHLVVDCKVNSWLRDIIKSSSEMSVKKNDLDKQNHIAMIAELRHQNTQMSNKIADDMEEQLKQTEK